MTADEKRHWLTVSLAITRPPLADRGLDPAIGGKGDDVDTRERDRAVGVRPAEPGVVSVETTKAVRLFRLA